MTHSVYIRADGSSAIGLGHLMRCIALAHMIKDFFQINFVCRAIPEDIACELSENRFELIRIKEESSFFKTLNPKDIAVIDGYDFDTSYQEQIKDTGCKLVCIDDTCDQEFVADLIINHSPGVKVIDYSAKEYTKFALGLEYALLRPAFLYWAQKPRKIDKIDSVLICFGGADYKNLTERTLNIALSFREFAKIVVITGSAYGFADSLIRLVQTDTRVSYHHSIDENEMLALMRTSDLAIVPASSVMIEALSQKMVVISGYYIENQKKAYAAALNDQLIFGIGDFFNFTKQLLKEKLFEIKNKITRGELVHARIGSDKLVNAFKSLT